MAGPSNVRPDVIAPCALGACPQHERCLIDEDNFGTVIDPVSGRVESIRRFTLTSYEKMTVQVSLMLHLSAEKLCCFAVISVGFYRKTISG